MNCPVKKAGRPCSTAEGQQLTEITPGEMARQKHQSIAQLKAAVDLPRRAVITGFTIGWTAWNTRPHR
jgi:hypothetical protein